MNDRKIKLDGITKEKIANLLGIDELPCEVVDKFFKNYEEEYNKLLEKLWEIK